MAFAATAGTLGVLLLTAAFFRVRVMVADCT
jgi:hypothetical protein